MQSIDGGTRSESTAKLIAKDISKYLYYADSKSCRPTNVPSIETLGTLVEPSLLSNNFLCLCERF